MEEPSTHILVMEDNPGDVGLLKAALAGEKDFPCQLDTAERLSEGLRRLSQETFDAVLLDLFLPDSSGLETLTQVHHNAPHVPIVVMTGLTNRETAVKALRGGAEDFLLKEELDGALVARSIRYALERHKLLVALREKEERYYLAAEGSNDGLWDWDLRSNRAFFSTRWKNMLGYSETEIGEDPQEWFKRVHPGDLKRMKEALNGHLSGKRPHFAHEHRLRHKDSRYRWVFCRGLAITDPQGRAIRIAGSFTDVTRHRDLEQRLVLRAFHDPLTGLPNRAFFIERLSQAHLRTERRPSRLFAIFFLDLDRFKYINDHFGHQTGDLMLIEVARRLQNSVRPTDVAARMGGDEFTVLLEDLVSHKEALSVAERILESLQEPFHLNEKRAVTAASIGIAFSDCGKPGPDGLLQAADAAMYRAKVRGKGHFEVFGEGSESGGGKEEHGS